MKALLIPLRPPWIHAQYFEELDSTQSVAAGQIAAGGDLRGVVLWAERQTAGRGRGARTWISRPGGLYVTAGLPELWTGDCRWLGWVPLIAAMACARLARERWGIPAMLKWPNDVWADGRKLAGMLGETGPATSEDRWILIGMGLNWINAAAEEGRAAGYDACAIGDYDENLDPDDRLGFLENWLAGVAVEMAKLAAAPEQRSEDLRREAGAMLLQRGEDVVLEHTEEGRIAGRLLGLSATAGAILRLADGREIAVNCGESGMRNQEGVC